VVSLWLGFMRTERTEPLFQNPEALKGPYGPFIKNYETPQFVGRVVEALYRDSARMEKSGRVHIAAELAEGYGVTEADGRQPKSSRQHLGGPPDPSAVVIR
jgi:hypothetical protein